MFLKDRATTGVDTLDLHDALPIFGRGGRLRPTRPPRSASTEPEGAPGAAPPMAPPVDPSSFWPSALQGALIMAPARMASTAADLNTDRVSWDPPGVSVHPSGSHGPRPQNSYLRIPLPHVVEEILLEIAVPEEDRALNGYSPGVAQRPSEPEGRLLNEIGRAHV